MFMKLNNCHAADAQWYMFYSKYIALPTNISFNLLEITSLPFTTEIGDPLCIPFFSFSSSVCFTLVKEYKVMLT